MSRYYFHTIWKMKSNNATYAHIHMFDTPQEARRAHANAGQWHWLTDEMKDPIVSPLIYSNEGRDQQITDCLRQDARPRKMTFDEANQQEATEA